MGNKELFGCMRSTFIDQVDMFGTMNGKGITEEIEGVSENEVHEKGARSNNKRRRKMAKASRKINRK